MSRTYYGIRANKNSNFHHDNFVYRGAKIRYKRHLYDYLPDHMEALAKARKIDDEHLLKAEFEVGYQEAQDAQFKDWLVANIAYEQAEMDAQYISDIEFMAMEEEVYWDLHKEKTY